MKVIYNDGHVAECPEDEELHVIRHTAAHILAQAVKRLYPEARFAYGPATEKGFYYDVDLGDKKLSDEDLPAIEAEMAKIVKENLPIKPFVLSREDAVKLMEERGETYKVEHIGDLPEDAVLSFYQQGEYIDMCIGPHLTYTKALKAFKLTQLSGAYWKNDKNNIMLTRIGGTAFRTREELEEYNKLMEEAMNELSVIAGQKAVMTRAKKSIAAFKLREGMPIGCRVTLRKERMWDFLDKLMNFALPRVRDFRGIPDRGFDGRGNFTLGIKEHAIFPEMEADRIENPKGMNITIVTTATTDKEGKFLLEQLGMPFRK